MARTLEQQIRELERRLDYINDLLPTICRDEEFEAKLLELCLISEQLHDLYCKLENGGDE